MNVQRAHIAARAPGVPVPCFASWAALLGPRLPLTAAIPVYRRASLEQMEQLEGMERRAYHTLTFNHGKPRAYLQSWA